MTNNSALILTLAIVGLHKIPFGSTINVTLDIFLSAMVRYCGKIIFFLANF